VRTTKDQTVTTGHSKDPARWQAGLDALMGRVAGRFARTHFDRGGGPGGWDSFTFVVLLKRLRPATDMG
jgi:hypothetical protein